MCNACWGPKEPPLDQPEYDEDEIEWSEEDIAIMKADEKRDERRGK